MRLTFPRLFASDVYGRTDEVDGKSCRPLFDAGSVEVGGEVGRRQDFVVGFSFLGGDKVLCSWSVGGTRVVYV